MNYKLKKLYNSRLIYKRVDNFQALRNVWRESIGEIQSILSQYPKIQMENDLWSFYFFLPSKSRDFSHTQVWIGREVVGFLAEEASKPLEVYDLCQGDCWEIEIGPKLPIEWEDVLILEDQLRQSLLGNSENIAPTWRLTWRVGHEMALQMFRNIS